ncbi:MAG: hypothetical protein ACTSPQ_11265 [Candidatus Helarchaeota archaeon]
MIQSILILRRSGENIYYKNLGSISMDETVMSGFFSALFTFSQALCGSDIEIIELGTKYKIVFKSAIHGSSEIIFAAICDIYDSIIKIHKVLESIKNYTILKYGDKIDKVGCDLSCVDELDIFIREILTGSEGLPLEGDLYNECKKVLTELDSNTEILDSALISSTGAIASTDKDKEFLNLMIRQLDAFFKFTHRVLDQIILKFQNRYIILYRVNDDLVISSLTKRNVPIGVATLLVEEAASKLAEIYESFRSNKNRQD